MVEILLAVFNGEQFLPGLLDSVMAQTETEWHITARDDCSEDGSFEILSSYARKYPEKFTVKRSSVPSGSSKANFMRLLSEADERADYIMFCDDDDIWYPDKIKTALEEMNRLGRENGGDIPLLVHTDMTVADRELNIISGSFCKYQGLRPEKCRSLPRLLAQNNVTGWTVMINRPLAELALKGSPEDMLMHDWWAALIAASYGKIGFIPGSAGLYRQHGGNALGAVERRSPGSIIKALKERKGMGKRVNDTYRQAERFLEIYRDTLPEEAAKYLQIYAAVPLSPKPVRIFLLVRHGFLKQSFLTAAGQLVFC